MNLKDYEPRDESVFEIGEKFDVSGKTVKKYYTKWGIKIPAHGSWIKKKKKASGGNFQMKQNVSFF